MLSPEMSGALIEAVVKSLQSTFHPMQVLKGGSAGKNTDVPGSDIDLVVTDMSRVLHEAPLFFEEI